MLEADLLLPAGTSSLKAKRSLVTPLVSRLRRQFDVAVAEVGHTELHGRTKIGAVVVSGDARHCDQVLSAVEQHLDDSPELEVLSVRRRWLGPHDDGDQPSKVSGDMTTGRIEP